MLNTIARPFLLRMNLQLFAGDGGGGSGGSGGDGGGSGGDGGNGGGAGGGSGEKTFTQAEVDAMMGQRLPRAEKAAQKALAKELGYDSVEAMQTALKKPDGGGSGNKEGDDKTLTMEDVEKRAKELFEAGQKEQNEKTFKRLLSAEVKVLANELGFVDWEEAMTFADLSEAKEDEKGNIIAKQSEDGKVTSVKEALETLATKKPHLLKPKASGVFGSTLPNGSGGKPPVGYDAGKSIAEQRNQKGSDKK